MKRSQPPSRKKSETQSTQEYREPALFSDRFIVVYQSGLVRLVFGDARLGTNNEYHTSVILSDSNAKELAGLLVKLLRTHTTLIPMDDQPRH